MAKAKPIALVNLDTGQAWAFQFFPKSLGIEDRANWEAADVTMGTRPLMYANREPQRISIDEVWLDSSDAGVSLTEEIEGLRSLMKETNQRTPPALRLICGDWQQRVVLEEMKVEEQLFDRSGNPLRARISLSFIEHVQIERVTVRTIEPEEDFNPIGNF
jgi:hypothetical protein